MFWYEYFNGPIAHPTRQLTKTTVPSEKQPEQIQHHDDFIVIQAALQCRTAHTIMVRHINIHYQSHQATIWAPPRPQEREAQGNQGQTTLGNGFKQNSSPPQLLLNANAVTHSLTHSLFFSAPHCNATIGKPTTSPDNVIELCSNDAITSTSAHSSTKFCYLKLYV